MQISGTGSNRTSFAIRKVDSVEADAIRARIVRHLLQRTIEGLKAELDAATWITAGWSELESFVDALCNNGAHPAINECVAGRANGGRPAPSTRELNARRLVVLFCESLERAGLNRRASRRFAVKELNNAGLFNGTISPKIIEYWQGKELPLAPDAELLCATGFAAAGGEPSRLAIYFIGLCHLALNPTAVAVPESSQELGDYIGRFEVG